MACLRAGGALAVSAVWHNLEKSAALPIGAAASTIALNACVAASCTTFGAPPEATPSSVAVQCSSGQPAAVAAEPRRQSRGAAARRRRDHTCAAGPSRACRCPPVLVISRSFCLSSGVLVSSPSLVKALRPSTRSSHSSDLSSCWTFWRVAPFFLYSPPTVQGVTRLIRRGCASRLLQARDSNLSYHTPASRTQQPCSSYEIAQNEFALMF